MPEKEDEAGASRAARSQAEPWERGELLAFCVYQETAFSPCIPCDNIGRHNGHGWPYRFGESLHATPLLYPQPFLVQTSAFSVLFDLDLV